MSHVFLVTDDASKNLKIDPLREKICGFITIIMRLHEFLYVSTHLFKESASKKKLNSLRHKGQIVLYVHKN